jgi:hypothetical protein
MDRLFSPCTRLYAMLESQGRLENLRGDPELLQELGMDVSTEELLTAERAFTYADLYAMLGNEKAVVWMTPHAAVMPVGGIGMKGWILLDGSCRSYFLKTDGKELFVLAHSPEHLSEICDILLRILAASVVHSVYLEMFDQGRGLLINAPTLAYLMEQCQSLKDLSFEDLEMDENHCRVLGVYSRSDLKIELIRCQLTAGTSALAEVLEGNQGPTSLLWCKLDYPIFADGLRGNSRLKSLALRFFSSSLEVDKRQLLAIASALQENKGLVELNVSHCDHTEWDET